MMKNNSFLGIIIGSMFLFFVASCSFPSTEESGIRYVTKPAFSVPENIEWKKVGTAKELINMKEKLVIISGGDNPITKEAWDSFRPILPWKKNIDRHILMDKTSFLRSPNAKSNCKGADCKTPKIYKDYSWVELATPFSVDYIPKKTNMLKPEEGHLVVKVIKKCQVVYFENEIFQLSDKKGNLYVMHATETATPNLDVVLPDGYSLKKIALKEPLVIVPFGEKEDCYFNIVGDHLGQGYHQYKYAEDYYPSAE